MIPENWEIWKLSHAYPNIGSGTTPSSNNGAFYAGDNEVGVPWITTSELRESLIETTATSVTNEAIKTISSLRVYAPGSLMIAMYGATIGRLGITAVAATCNQACCVFERSEWFDNKFLFYWLWHRRKDLIALSVGGGQPNLSQQDLKEERVSRPSTKTQKNIVEYLDAKTTQIDELVEKKRTLLDRLAEKRRTLFTHAVTKGLNPDAPMKPSGLDWIGLIPTHWELLPLKRIISYQEGPGIMAIDFREEGIPLLRVSSVGGRYATLTGVNYLDPLMAHGKWKHFLTEVGDLLISASATSGVVSEVAEDTANCVPYTGIIRIKPIEEVADAEFIRHWLISDVFLSQIEQLKAGSTIQHFGPYHLGLMSIAKPPPDEQKIIGRWITERAEKLDRQTQLISESIRLLLEYRASVITSAMTGNIAGAS